MICDDELRFLHYLGRRHQGLGACVDFGPLAGSSTYALASGLAAAGSDARIYSYDLWRFYPDWQRFFPRVQLQPGDDILPLFMENLGRHRGRVVPTKGDICHAEWKREPIEIMFIDAAKTPDVMRHIVNVFYPYLVPGALIVHQDYVSAQCPWIHIVDRLLRDFFEYADSPYGGSICVRVKKPMPANLLPANYYDSIAVEDARTLLAQARGIFPDCWERLCVWLAEAYYFTSREMMTEATWVLEQVIHDPAYDEPHLRFDLDYVGERIRATLKPGEKIRK